MSSKNRKIGYYFLEVKNNEKKLEPDILRILIKTIVGLPDIEKKDEIKGTNKMQYLYSVKDINNIQNLIFVSAKHHHLPPIIDSETVLIRDNPKNITEGEMEKTHVVLKYTSNGIILLLEERAVGISIKSIIRYFNKFFVKTGDEATQEYQIEYSVIPSENFLTELNKLKRAKIGEIYFDKSILGSEYLAISDRNEEIQENVIITIKAKKTMNIINKIKNIDGLMTDGRKPISKIRVYGISNDGSNIMIDSEFCRNVKYTQANVDDIKGIVESEDLFNKMNEMAQYV